MSICLLHALSSLISVQLFISLRPPSLFLDLTLSLICLWSALTGKLMLSVPWTRYPELIEYCCGLETCNYKAEPRTIELNWRWLRYFVFVIYLFVYLFVYFGKPCSVHTLSSQRSALVLVFKFHNGSCRWRKCPLFEIPQQLNCVVSDSVAKSTQSTRQLWCTLAIYLATMCPHPSTSRLNVHVYNLVQFSTNVDLQLCKLQCRLM